MRRFAILPALLFAACAPRPSAHVAPCPGEPTAFVNQAHVEAATLIRETVPLLEELAAAAGKADLDVEAKTDLLLKAMTARTNLSAARQRYEQVALHGHEHCCNARRIRTLVELGETVDRFARELSRPTGPLGRP